MAKGGGTTCDNERQRIGFGILKHYDEAPFALNSIICGNQKAGLAPTMPYSLM
jgi:hypothetical protein